jgi:hypothetical protein
VRPTFAADRVDECDIGLAFDAYLGSPHKSDIKFALLLQYSWMMSRGGAYFQEGSRYLDAIGWARGGEIPPTYTYPLDLSWL